MKIATLSRTGYSNGWSGTSIAAPVVAGVAALAFSAQPGATVAQVKAALLSTVDASPSLAGKTVTGGKLNAYAAISALTGRTDSAAPTDTGTATSTPPATQLHRGRPHPGGHAEGREQRRRQGQEGDHGQGQLRRHRGLLRQARRRGRQAR